MTPERLAQLVDLICIHAAYGDCMKVLLIAQYLRRNGVYVAPDKYLAVMNTYRRKRQADR